MSAYPGWSPTHQFHAWYAHQLGTLTFNSRPIIDKLSMAALERKREGDWDGMSVVGEVIRRGIEVAPPTQKLPLFYLVDSIAKNAGAPYTTHILPPFLAQTYLSTYHQVDPLTRKKMEDMLTTWRTTPGVGTPEGELFPRDVRSTIEMGIYGRQVPAVMPQMYNMPSSSSSSGYPVGFAPPPSAHMPPASPFGVPTPPPQQPFQFHNQPPPPPPPPPPAAAPTRDSVITSLLTTLSAKRAQLAKHPHETSTRGTVGILEQLQTHLMAGNVSPHELAAIQQQLDGLRGDPYARSAEPSPASMPTPVPAPAPAPPPPPPPRPEPPISMPKPIQLPFGLPGLNLPIPAASSNPTQSPHMPHAATAPPVAPPPVAPPVVVGGAPVLDFSSLLGNLARAGILSQTGTPVPGPASGQVKAEDTPDGGAAGAAVAAAAVAEPEEADGMDEYEELILGLNVQLTLSDLNQTRTFQPTTHLPNRCSQCAARFAAGKKGKDRLQQHLDWHFRRNRKERESTGRGANRRWLPRVEAWVNDITETFTGVRDEDVDPAAGSLAGMAPRPTAAAMAQRRANEELVKKWVVVPAEDKAGGGKRRCPICKEEFVDEFVQDEEEWVWRNCVKVKNSYYHATCRADALATAAANRKATAAVADLQRGASPSGTASREATPAPAPGGAVKAQVAQSPLRAAVKLESAVANGVAGTGLDVESDAELNSLKRKAEGSPDADKDVKKERSV